MSRSDLRATRRCKAVLFDLDGVLTPTATLHARAWKATFDAFLASHGAQIGKSFEPFDLDLDYRAHVDGRRRGDGVRAFLASRGIEVPEGTSSDAPTVDSIHGIGLRKNERFREELESGGIEPYADAVALVRALSEAGTPCAVVSSSANAQAVLEGAGIADRFRDRVDGRTAQELGLKGKPAADMFLEAARRLQVAPADAAVIEDAIAGVQAGRHGGFGWVVGVARHGEDAALAAAGADPVVSSLDGLHELLIGPTQEPRT